MGVRIAGERLPGRLKRRRVDSGDRVGLREVEDERRLEEDAPLLAILAVAGLDGDRREDPDCLLALADCAPELDPGVEPGDVLGDDPALMGTAGRSACGSTPNMHGTSAGRAPAAATPAMTVVAGGFFDALSVGTATLLALGL